MGDYCRELKVTRILFAATDPALLPICKAVAFMRADIWRRYGALGTVGKKLNSIKPDFPALYGHLDLDGTIRAETSKDVLNDIYTYKAAAKEKAKKAIRNRTADKAELKRLYTLLKRDDWLSDNFLHRQMRRHFRHGVSKCDNQFVVRSDKFTTAIVADRMVVTIRISPKHGKNIKLVTTTNGKNVKLISCNLRIIVKGDITEIHYCADKGEGREPGVGTIGVDKGYTEAFADSRGDFHGNGFGVEMTRYSDASAKSGKARNRLHAIKTKHLYAGRTAKASRINANNLGRKKMDARRVRTQQRLRTLAFKAAHGIVDKASRIGAEDLTSPIASKHQWKRFNRRMSSWAKGVLAEALESVTEQRGAELQLVASAYTSQIDSQTRRLEGKRVGDRFYHASGDVSHADINAALNVEHRMDDPEIGRYTPHLKIKRILLARSSGATERQGVELRSASADHQPTADKSYAQERASL